MTVADLIQELQQLPQHHTVVCNIGARYEEAISGAAAGPTYDSKAGPMVTLFTVSDPRNDPDWDPYALTP